MTGPTRRTRPVRLAKAVAVIDRRPDGTVYLRNPTLLGPYPVALTDRLVEWARKAPERTLAAQRDASGTWQHLTYAARSIACCGSHRLCLRAASRRTGPS